MTDERDMDRLMGAFFSDGATRAPDRVLDVVSDRLERQPQRPAWRFGWRDRVANPQARLASGLVAAVVVAVVGVGLIQRGSIGSATPTASPSAAPTAGPTTTPTATPPATSLTTTREYAELAPGRYVFDRSSPHVTFDVPAGWMFEFVRSGHVSMRPAAFESSSSVSTWYDMRIAAKDAACTEQPEPGVGHTASDLVADFTTRPGIVATTPEPVSVGGLEGQSFDLALSPDWTATCPQFPELGAGVPLFIDDLPDDLLVNGNPYWGVSGTERLRMIVLDDGHGSTVLITLTAPDAATFDRLVAVTMPVIDTFAFDQTP